MSKQLSRRTVLQGIGASLALPYLEAMNGWTAYGAPAVAATPKRLAYFYVPNGVHMQDWSPEEVGPGYKMPFLLESTLSKFREDLLVLSGLTVDKARANGDGPGDHARSLSSFLTCRQARKTNGADIRVGVSVDQIAAQKIGQATRFSSLELGIDKGQNAGNCDSGYSCAYSNNLSWRSESTPMAKENDPKQVFERLFASSGETSASLKKRDDTRKSILDVVGEDANSLRGKLGATDKRKLDEYLSAVREIEMRLNKSASNQIAAPKFTPAESARPTGIPKEFQDHCRLMFDMMVLAFQADLTRVATFVIANEGSNRNYKSIGVAEGHHELSHHGNDKAKYEKIKKINQYHLQQFAYFLEKLKGTKEGNASLLDSSMLVYGSAIGDGNRHNHDELPILVAGKGAGTLKTGQHLRFAKDTPLANLHLSLLERMGVNLPSFGDSTGKLENIGS
ncbi:MAG: DUF1552 domain-containing protein [Gemmataceae bacterium]|nr:DUF1552 domain-containing protein [Gemmataceae bacterium]MBJ7495358.1 DUF1552 domain-containing protein [Gemmataceae bacterium]